MGRCKISTDRCGDRWVRMERRCRRSCACDRAAVTVVTDRHREGPVLPPLQQAIGSAGNRGSHSSAKDSN